MSENLWLDIRVVKMSCATPNPVQLTQTHLTDAEVQNYCTQSPIANGANKYKELTKKDWQPATGDR